MTPLWVAIDLPLLALEAHQQLPAPSAVGDRHRLIACDAVSSRAGLRPGMGVAAARALLPSVQIVARDVACEQATLERLACWAGSLTPQISMVSDDTGHALLLDIGTCLRLFGGLDGILSRVRDGMRDQGVTLRLAVAPVAQAALWLARADSNTVCTDYATMHQRLQMLPLDVLPPRTAEKLAGFGMHTLADVRALPSGALARRLDTDALQCIARAFGDLPEARELFVFPKHFSMALELPAPVEAAEALLFATQRLVAALAGWLSVRQAGIAEMTLHLLHRRDAVPAATPVVIRFTELTRDRLRIERLLRERLQRLPLSAAVESMRLDATRIDALPGQTVALFTSSGGNAAAMGELIERLRVRLGETCVFGLAEVADHRPECATRQVARGVAAQGRQPGDRQVQSRQTRPFWLLALPKALSEINGRPFHRGPLQLLAGPERIESGWWTNGEAVGDVRRDYFVALTADSRWLWIYRECRLPGGWFLHGFFA